MTRTDSATRALTAAPESVFAALVDVDARTQWLPPSGMSGHFEWFDARPGGGYRLILSYDDPGIAGKSEAHTDIADVRFVAIDTPRQVIEEADFVSDDPRLSATMTITWSVALASTLANLADYLAAR